MITRRGLLGGILALCAAPAIVRVANIMPVKVMPIDLIGDFSTENMIVRATERYSGMYGMSYARFAEILRPGLTEIFSGVYDNVDFAGVIDARA